VSYDSGDASAYGGGIWSTGAGAALTIYNSTISGNTATSYVNGSGAGGFYACSYGGGIANYNGSVLELYNSTVFGNEAASSTAVDPDNEAESYGGGIYIYANSTSTIRNSTITQNTVSASDPDGDNEITDGAGLYMVNANTTLNVRNSILAQNTDNSTAFDYYYAGGTLSDGGYNVVEYQNTAKFDSATSILFNFTRSGAGSSQWTRNNSALSNQTLGLASTLALNDSTNGTWTLALGVGSFAAASASGNGIPYGSPPNWNSSPFTDQRGIARTADQYTSIGAYSNNYAFYYFRSKATGNWNATGTWEQSLDGDSWEDATETPTDTSLGVTIRDGHTVTVSASVTTDQTTVTSGGTLTVASGQTLTVADGDGTDLNNNGTMDVNGTLSIADGAAIDANGDLDATTGAVTFTGGGSLTLGGTVTSLGTFTAGTATVTYDQAGDQQVAGVTYYDLSTSSSGTKTFGGNVTVENTLNTGVGTTLALGSRTLNIGSSNSGTGSWTHNGNFDAGTGTVVYGETGAQNVLGETYHNLTTSGSSTKTLAGAIDVNGNLSIAGGVTLDVSASNYGVNLSGNWSNSGSFSGQIGTVIFDGSAGQGITGSNSFYNLTVNNAHASAYVDASSSTLAVSSLLNILDGQFKSASDYHHVTIGANGTLELSGDITVSGNWSNSGNLTHSDNAVIFDGSGTSTITGSTTFYDFSCITADKILLFDSTDGKTQTISNWFTITGASDHNVVIGPSAATDGAAIDVTYSDVQYATVSYSNNSGNTVYPANSTDGGNNTGWDFGSSGILCGSAGPIRIGTRGATGRAVSHRQTPPTM
jgi:hypothetical protein